MVVSRFVLTLGLAGAAMANNAHRHLHQQHHKQMHRDVVFLQTDVVTVTEVVTVTVYDEDATSTPYAAPTMAAKKSGKKHHYSEGYAPKSSSPAAAAAPVTTEAAAPAAPVPEVPVPEVPVTTLATEVKQTKPKPTEAAAAVPSDTEPAAPAAPVPAAPAAPAGGKRGLAYNDPKLLSLFTGSGSKCTWAYNWGSWFDLTVSVDFVPLLWGLKSDFTNVWKNNVNNAISKGSTHVLGFNEADLGSQANIPDIGTCVQGHVTYMKEFADRGIKIGAPSVTNSVSKNQGLDYLSQFIAKCDATVGCHVDFCPIHWYDSASKTADFIQHVKNAHDACGGRPIWITEFAPQGSDAQVDAFLKTVLPQLDGLDFLERYSYFMVSQGRLVSGSSLSSYGMTYVSS